MRFGEGSQPTLQGQVEAAVENALRLALYLNAIKPARRDETAPPGR